MKLQYEYIELPTSYTIENYPSSYWKAIHNNNSVKKRAKTQQEKSATMLQWMI